MTRLILAGLALSLLAGCGMRGDLSRPPPLWGNPTDRSPEEQKEKAARDRQQQAPDRNTGAGEQSSSIPIPQP